MCDCRFNGSWFPLGEVIPIGYQSPECGSVLWHPSARDSTGVCVCVGGEGGTLKMCRACEFNATAAFIQCSYSSRVLLLYETDGVSNVCVRAHACVRAFVHSCVRVCVCVCVNRHWRRLLQIYGRVCVQCDVPGGAVCAGRECRCSGSTICGSCAPFLPRLEVKQRRWSVGFEARTAMQPVRAQQAITIC